MKKCLLLLAVLALLLPLWPATTASAASGDYAIVDGYFFPQTGASAGAQLGYTVTNEDGIPFWDEFQRLGGVEAVGYPISQRFVWSGFVTQVMQKAVFQWRPEVKRVYLVNVFDDLHDAGKDDWLYLERSTPRPLPASFDEGLPWAQAVSSRLALLDENQAIREAYFAAAQPLDTYGLPTSRVEFFGNHYAIRLQRAVIQQWMQDVPWAKAGQVTIANGGDIAKEAGLWPAAALAPIQAPPPAPEVIAARGTSDTSIASVQRLAVQSFPAVVSIAVRGTGLGSGIIIDERGYVLTNYHVVGEARQVQVYLSSGQRVEGQVVGSDSWSDLALIKLQGDRWPFLPLGDSDSLSVRQQVVAVGYSPLLSASPGVTTGTVTQIIGSRDPGSGSLLIFATAPIYPGFSGGPLLNMDGQVVGIGTAIVSADNESTTNQSLSIAINSARPVVDSLLSQSHQGNPWIGIIPYTLTPELSRLNGLGIDRGVIVVSIYNPSPAWQAGLRRGDTIVRVQGQPVTKVGDLLLALSSVPAGQEVEVEVVDLAGRYRSVKIQLSGRPISSVFNR